MTPRIGHLDADCFYVSCERVRHPFLRGQPVGVLSNQGACVIAKSYELKARGVPTGMPIWEALPVCPEAIFVKRDFEWYEVLSRRMLEIVRELRPAVEYYSIDEMFFDAREMTFADAKRLQRAIYERTGVPVSVGLSLSKTLAKLASSSGKPLGCVMAVGAEEVQQLLRGRPVEKITGIARRSARRLEGYGIRTCEEFARADRRLIRRLLTKRGEDLWWELNGTPVLPVQTARTAHKNLARGGSLGVATADPERLTGWVARNAERLVEALDYHRVDCAVLAMSLEFKDGGAAGAQFRLPRAAADFPLLYETGIKLLERCWGQSPVVSYMHLIAGELTPRAFAQRSLFDRPTPRQEVLAEVKRQVNERLGRFALRSGATLPLADLYADEASSYDVCDIYGKTCF
ncbi:MAG: nucleotidyltransferase [Pirellulales bacterium]|nr:nucleotidyltransferase [Pirellulales bacterium]